MNTRRRHERFAADIPCRVFIPAPSTSSSSSRKSAKGDKNGAGNDVRFEAFLRVRDLSFGGAFIESGFQFANLPEQLHVELTLPDEKVPVRGRIVRYADGGMGIAFDELPMKAREALLRHFVPAAHKAFHASIKGIFPKLEVDRVSLLLHLWEEWKVKELS